MQPRQLYNTHIPNPNYLVGKASCNSYIIHGGRRIKPSKFGEAAPDSIIQCVLNGERYVGQVIKVFTHSQPRVDRPKTLLHVKWFKRASGIDCDHWIP